MSGRGRNPGWAVAPHATIYRIWNPRDMGMMLERDPYLDRIRDIVLDALSGYAVTVYLFGSRARGSARRASDVDIAVEAREPLPPQVLARLRDRLEESTVPYRVEILDFASAGDDLRMRIKQEGVVWNASANA